MLSFSRTLLVSIFAGLAVTAASAAAAKEFSFKDPKGVNSMTFVLDSELEPIMGLASGISGTVSFDPADAKKTTGKLVVDAKSINCSNPAMTKVLHADDWLNVEKHGEVTFTFKEVKDAKSSAAGEFEMTVVGDFSCAGVTKELTIPVKATYKKDGAGGRLKGAKGDLLILRAAFTINRKDFKIKTEMGPEVVSEEIEIRASIVGMSAEK